MFARYAVNFVAILRCCNMETGACSLFTLTACTSPMVHPHHHRITLTWYRTHTMSIACTSSWHYVLLYSQHARTLSIAMHPRNPIPLHPGDPPSTPPALHDRWWPAGGRWGPKGVDDYKVNLREFLEHVQTTVRQDTMLIWLTTMPVSSEPRGGFLIKQVMGARPRSVQAHCGRKWVC